MADRPTVVLDHGAWHGAWCWEDVASRLRADGQRVVVVELPSVAAGGDMYDDAQAVHDAIAAVDGETVVVGHSYGGVVITEGAAGLPGVRHRGYVTAFMLDEGESLLSTVGGTLPDWVKPATEGRGMIATDGERVFYNTCAPEAAHAAAERLRPQANATFEQPVRSVAWREVPFHLRRLRPRQRDPRAGTGGDGGTGADHAPPRERPLAVPQRPRRAHAQRGRRAAGLLQHVRLGGR